MWNYFIISILISVANCEYKYETKLFKVPLDHFGYQRKETFSIKYLENNDYWDKGNGPIFFYTGNEGQIELFAKHCGFMWEIAKEFKAKIIFAEHRYYGESMPFGKNESLKNENIGFLTSEQALADYAELVNFLEGDALKPNYPVIAFGGSYGGMLAAYFRMKYPHIVTGAIAASAPIHMFSGMVPCNAFHGIVTYSFTRGHPKCAANIRHSWSILKNNTNTLKTTLNLCEPVKDEINLKMLFDFLESMYVALAMVNYPFPSDFLVPLPANPVNTVCQHLNQDLNETKLIEGIGRIVKTYTNYNGNNNKCLNITNENNGNLDDNGWNFQACTEMVMPMCKNGVNDMFEPKAWNFTQYSQDCFNKYKVYPRENAAKVIYGGMKLDGASNIVFTNGELDPWSVGGILNNVGDSIIAMILSDAAHHLDLMASNPSDPASVKTARNVHKQNIAKWIQQFSDAKAKFRSRRL